jgi:hypothetical protein
MNPSVTVAQDRRRWLAVRARIEELEVGVMTLGQDQFPPASGAKALVREQARRMATERPPESLEPVRELAA